MVKTYFYESFTNDFLSARTKLKNILKYLRDEIGCLTEDDLFDLRIIYNELIINAITHGNLEDDTKKVELLIEMDDGIITSVVRDEGSGFDYSSLCPLNPTPEEQMDEHGRGLKLVTSLVDFFEWNKAGNEIKIYKKYQVR